MTAIWVGEPREVNQTDLDRGWPYAYVIEYGVVIEGHQVGVNYAATREAAADRAANLSSFDQRLVLSDRQREVLEYLCAIGRSLVEPILEATAATRTTLVTLELLDLTVSRTVGARGTLIHLTDLGRAAIRCQRLPGDEPWDEDDIPGVYPPGP